MVSIMYCRTCGSTDVNVNNTKIYNKDENGVKVSDKIIRCCSNIDIKLSDGLSTIVCGDCEKLLDSFYQFVVNCEIFNEHLKNKPDLYKHVKQESNLEEFYQDEDNDFDADESHLRECSVKIEIEIKENEKFVDDCLRKRSYKKRVLGTKSNICSICNRNCKTQSALSIHMRSHSDERQFLCSLCKCKYKDKGSLKRHIERRHLESKRERKFICDDCGKAFFEKPSLRQHVRIHTGETPYPCSTCGATFSQISSLSRHRRIHTGDNPYKCNKCDKKFKSSSELDVHQLVHTEIRNYSCHICHSKFKNKLNCKKHIKKFHLDPSSYICNHCGTNFRLVGNLNKHIERMHSNKSGLCDLCHKNVSNLEAHMWTHTGEKPFKCEQCMSSFSSSRSLAKHVSFRHINTGKFKCEALGCSCTFPVQHMLRVHIAKVHEKKALFKCNRCPRKFYRKSDLVRHNIGTHKSQV